MTFEAVTRTAAAQPSATAIIANGTYVPYGALPGAIAKFAEALRGFGLRRGSAVAIQCGDQHLHLLLILACERLGLISASFNVAEFDDYLPLLERFQLVVTEHPERVDKGRQVLPLTRAWLDMVATLKGDAGEPLATSPEDPLRIARTSGTTGTPKLLLLKRRMHQGRTKCWQTVEPTRAGNRHLMVSPFAMQAMHSTAIYVLASGAALVFETRVSAVEAIRLHGITHVGVLPQQLRDMIDKMPPDYPKPERLSIFCGGGAISVSLRQAVLAKLATRISEFYGANEVGQIAEIVPDAQSGTWPAMPGLVVEIVDEDEKVLPFGEIGRVRCKTPFMAEAYLGDPETSARAFRDGWFYTNDSGVLHGPGRLEIKGRIDDVINIGGLKLMPGVVEDKIRDSAPIKDIGICAVPGPGGAETIWVGLVYDGTDDRKIQDLLAPLLAKHFPARPNFVKLSFIPRTVNGKIRRGPLREIITAALARLAQAQKPSDAKTDGR